MTENIRRRRIQSVYPGMQQRLFPGYGHFCLGNMKTAEFPELKAIVLAGKSDF